MKNLLVAGFILLFFNAKVFAKENSSQYLISEMEALRDSLKIDDPKRIELTLRLADLYFDVSIQEGKSEDVKAQRENRLKALDLYKHSLNGTDNLKKATGLNRIKIQFQMARLLTRLNEGKMAEPYYLEIINNKETPKKMIEQSALALAEWHEDEAKYVDAKKYYDKAVLNCSDRNSCNYANYRLGWLYYKDTKLDDAILTMEKSIWTDETTLRENSLTDYILFLSNKEKSDGTRELEKIKKIAIKANRPEIIRQLVEAFYVAGNRFAGSTLLAELNKTDSNLYYEVRLLEEFYGFRNWDKVQHYLSVVEKRKVSDLPKKPEEAKEVLAIFRRFIVQVDAEMQVIPNLKDVLKRSINSYVNLYPKDELRSKMQSGWLAATEDRKEKMEKLSSWIKDDLTYKNDPSETRKLRQMRLALAQQEKNSAVIIEESRAIAEILKGTKEADEFIYVAAHEYYVQKNEVEALKLFNQVLLSAKGNKEVSNWALLSENLILDIYNHQKNYDGIISSVNNWKEFISSANVSLDVLKESKSLETILVQAEFEKAFSLKDTKEALLAFSNFCFNDQYSEKSCANAKVLSIKFKDQDRLIKILGKMGDHDAEATELELMGKFTEAAKVREQFLLSKNPPSIEEYIRTAFLHELNLDYKERDRVLSLMIEAFKGSSLKIPLEVEKAVYTALDEANLINEKALSMPWSVNYKIKMASRIQVVSPNVESRNVLLSEKEGSGPVWSKVVLSHLEDELLKTNKIKFYGSQSKKLFKQRTSAIENFASLAKPKLETSDLEARVYILHMLKLAYKTMAQEILNSPIPDGLDAQTLNMVTTQITNMADPFDKVNEDYDRLITEQIKSLKQEDVKAKVSKNISGEVKNYADLIQYDGSEKVELKISQTFDQKEANLLRQKLLTEPEDKKVLSSLKELYTKNKCPRIASYYASRIEALKQVE
jgi:tetratricopeptide (TPR) repeat protein